MKKRIISLILVLIMLLGFMSAPWHLTIPEMVYGLMHDATCQKLAI